MENPDMQITVFQWLKSLNKDWLKLVSRETTPIKGEACKPMSNSELQRLMDQGGVLINGEKVNSKELLDFPINSLVLYPKSESKRITVW